MEPGCQRCLICDDKAIGINFGVLTCMACKAFFRRNAVKLGNYDFVCVKDGDCFITHTNRRMCKCCRLAKCFRVGMIKALILSDAEKAARWEIVQRNRQQKYEKILQIATKDVIQSPHLHRSIGNKSFYLSLFDNTNLSNILNAYELTYGRSNPSHNSNFPRTVHSSMHTFMNEYSSTHQLLPVYFKRIPEYTTIPLEDKIRLFRNQFGFINNIIAAIALPGISTNLILSFTNIYGSYLANHLLQSIERIQPFTYDPVILKLLVIIIAFSQGNYRNLDDCNIDHICDNTLAIFSAQNIYVELLWKYTLSRSANEFDAVKYFDRLIRFLLYLLHVHSMLDVFMSGLHNEIDQMEPLLQSMWPKTVQVNRLTD